MPTPQFADHLTHLAALRAAALRAVDPAAAVRRSLAPADFANAERIFVVGAGKAGVAMTLAAAEILGDRLTRAVVAVPARPSPSRRPPLPPPLPAHSGSARAMLAGDGGTEGGRITFIEGGHPAPTPGSLAAGRAVADLLSRTASRDLVIALISGGGSATLELPIAGLTLGDLQSTTAALLKCGATIHELNTVRTQLSQLKGGGLARLVHPARSLALILSDVVGNDLSIIASGPTVPATTTRADALRVIDRYGLRPVISAATLRHLTADDGRPPTESSIVGRPSPVVENRIVASNRFAVEAAVAEAQLLGFSPCLIADDWQGEAREVGKRFAALVASPPGPLASAPGRGEGGGVAPQEPGWGVMCLIVGGESTVTVRGHGKGGRNTEAALAAAVALEDVPNVVVSTFATDGVDGPTDAAGAVVRGDTVARARALGLDPQQSLDDNDSYSFFAALGDLVITGPTGTNVNDLMFGLVY